MNYHNRFTDRHMIPFASMQPFASGLYIPIQSEIVSEMQIDDHAFDRMTLRLEDDERKQIIQKIESVWNRVQDCMKKDVGVIAMRISDIRMTDNSGYESNGDSIVGIVRKGCLKTVMLRRLSQPMTKNALRVDKIKWGFKAPKANKRAYKGKRF